MNHAHALFPYKQIFYLPAPLIYMYTYMINVLSSLSDFSDYDCGKIQEFFVLGLIKGKFYNSSLTRLRTYVMHNLYYLGMKVHELFL